MPFATERPCPAESARASAASRLPLRASVLRVVRDQLGPLCAVAMAMGCSEQPPGTANNPTEQPPVAARSGTPVAGTSSGPVSAAGTGPYAAGSSATPPRGNAGSTSVAPPSGASGSTASSAGTSSQGTAGLSGSVAGSAAGAGTPPPSAGAGGDETPGAAGASAGSTAPEPGTALDDTRTLIPDASWTCGLPAGIPGPATGKPIFEIDFTVSAVHDLGETQFGHREQIDVSGGKVSGEKLTAELLDRGLDYQLTLASGVVELEQIHILRAGTSYVYMRNCGVSPGPVNQVRVVLDFEAPNGSSVAWLNEGTYVGSREWDPQTKKLLLKVYEVTAPANTADAVTIPAPPAGPHQTWECKKVTGSNGAVVYTESVGIGAGSANVGASKRGTRNIIPITGCSTSGKIVGGVLSGGADFQLIAGGVFELDARYTLKTSDNELIIVRNCGPLGALVPVFEASKTGKYAWINEGDYLSSNPSIAPGAVNLTIYEKR